MANISDQRDSNEAEIVKALRDAGCSVQLLRKSGPGVPDLLVGCQRANYLLEVKTATGKLKPKQTYWLSVWQGQVAVVRTAEEALHAVGLL